MRQARPRCCAAPWMLSCSAVPVSQSVHVCRIHVQQQGHKCRCLCALVTRVVQVRTREAFAAKHKNVLRNWGVESSFPPEAVCHTDARVIPVAHTHVATRCMHMRRVWVAGGGGRRDLHMHRAPSVSPSITRRHTHSHSKWMRHCTRVWTHTRTVVCVCACVCIYIHL